MVQFYDIQLLVESSDEAYKYSLQRGLSHPVIKKD